MRLPSIIAFCLVFTLFFFLPPTQIFAASYFVSPTGVDTNAGTVDVPFKTLLKATNTAVAGDTVNIRAGSYSEILKFSRSGAERVSIQAVTIPTSSTVTFASALSGVSVGDYVYVYRSWKSNNGHFKITGISGSTVTVEGTPFIAESDHVIASIGTPIIFRAYPGETVTINARVNAPNVNFGNYDSTSLVISYVIVDGVRVTNSMASGVLFKGGRFNVITNSAIYGNDRPGVYMTDLDSSASTVNGSMYNIVSHSDISANGKNGPGEGVYIGYETYDDGSDYNAVIHNTIHDISEDEGTEIKRFNQYSVIEGNTYTNCSSTWGVVKLGVEATPASTYSLVYGNMFTGSSGNAAYAGVISVYMKDNTIFNNVINGATGLDGIWLAGGTGNNKLYHNTIRGVDVGIGFDGSGTGYSGVEIKNTLLSGNTTQIGAANASALSSVVIDSNVIHGVSLVTGTNSIATDPLFVSSSDSHVQAASVVRDRGIPVGILTDYAFVTRPQGTAPEIGAYELSAIAPTPIPTTIPTPTPTPSNAVPTINNALVIAGSTGTVYSTRINASDLNASDTLTMTVSNAPLGLTLGRCAKTITYNASRVALYQDYNCYLEGTPTNAGTFTSTFTVNDGRGGIRSRAYTISIVSSTNTVPTINNAVVTSGAVNSVYSTRINASDLNADDSLVMSVSGAPSGLTLGRCAKTITYNASRVALYQDYNCYLEGTPMSAGTFTSTFTVNDGRGGIRSRAYTVTITGTPTPTPSNTAPTINNAVVISGTVNTAYSTRINASDLNASDTLTMTVSNAPPGLTLGRCVKTITYNASRVALYQDYNCYLEGTPTSTGTWNTKFTVSDGAGGSGERVYQMIIN